MDSRILTVPRAVMSPLFALELLEAADINLHVRGWERVIAMAVLAIPAVPIGAFLGYLTGTCAAGVQCTTSLDCPAGLACLNNGGGTRYCVGGSCGGDDDCGGGAVCRQYCTVAGCDAPRCQCPGFGCGGPDEVCLDSTGLACHKLCTQDSDCVDPFGLVCINSSFEAGICIGTVPCQ